MNPPRRPASLACLARASLSALGSLTATLSIGATASFSAAVAPGAALLITAAAATAAPPAPVGAASATPAPHPALHATPVDAVSTASPPSAPVDAPPSAADADAARFCRPIRFVAYSTLEPSGQKVDESVTWDDAKRAYVIRGPVLAYMLNDPGVAALPAAGAAPRTMFQIAIRKELSRPIDRLCEYGFQEAAQCDSHGNIIYTQVYTGCDLQTLQHVTELTPDHAGALQLLDLRFEDVQGNLSNPLYLSEDSDLRQKVR